MQEIESKYHVSAKRASFSEFRLRERPVFKTSNNESITKSVLDGKPTKKWTPSWLDEAETAQR